MAPDTRPKSVAKANAVFFGTEHTAHKTDDSADWGFSLPKIHAGITTQRFPVMRMADAGAGMLT